MQNNQTNFGPLWNGSPQFATKNNLLSTSAGLATYTTTTSNALQTEINAIVAGGTTSLWANYPAIANVDMAGYSLNFAKFVSTLDLQVSSINGSDINFNKDTVDIAGVVINNGTITTTNITNAPAKGGGGGGGDNPTTGGSGNSTWSMVNSAIGATMDTVSKTQQAISGVLNNTGAVLFQAYYAVETAGAVIDLANGAVRLATNAQALYDTREQNLIAGPGGPPGQTSYVYETINGTTQFQFSTLGSPVYSVFRTTDQVNPNKTFGREIFTSTIIPAGSKVVRSVSDPYQFNILSTCLLSTTNYMQSFGQWNAILQPDYNLYASTLTADGISSLSLSTGKAFISSINGQPISAFLNTGDATFNSLSTNKISTATINVSSISSSYIYGYNGFFNNLTISSLNASTVYIQNIIDNFVSTTTGEFDLLTTSTLVATQIFTNKIETNNITGLDRLTLSNVVGNSYSAVYPTKSLSSFISSISLLQSGYFAFETNAAPSPPVGINYINSIYGVWVYPSIGPTFGTTNLLQQVVYIQPSYAGTPNTGTLSFFAVGSSGFEVNFIQQGDGLSPAATPYIVEPGCYVKINYNFTPGDYQNATYTVNSLYTPIPGSATSTLTTSKVNLIIDVYETVLDTANTYQNSGTTTTGLGNLALNVSTIVFGSNTSRNNTIPYTFNGAVYMPNAIIPQITASSISGCLYNSLVSTIPTKAGIAGANQTLLNAYVGIYSPIPLLDLTQLFTFSDANYSYWNNNGFVAGNNTNLWYCSIENLVVNTSATVDFYIGDYAYSVRIDYPGTTSKQQLFIGSIGSGFPQKVRFTFASGSWSYTYSFSSTSLDNYNSLVINQNASQTSINTTDSLILSTSYFQIYGDTYLNNLIGQFANISTLSSVNVNTGQIKAANITTPALSTTNISTSAIIANSITANSLTANSLTANSLITGSLTMTSGLTIPYLSTINISTSIATAANLIALTRLTTPSISTLKVLNGFNARAIQNPGNIIIYQQTVSFGNGTGTLDINTSPWVPGVYTASAVCRGNPLRTLEATFYYTNSSSQFCQNSQGFDNYNGQYWEAYPGYLRFVSRTDGGGDTFDVYMYLISGQYTAIGDDPPFPFPSSVYATTASVNTGTPTPIIIGLSTMIGSTITMQATENFSILANISPPAYFSTGSITVAGTNQVNLLGNIVAIGGQTDVDIQANTNNVNIVASSNINLTGSNSIQLNSSNVNIDTFTTIQLPGTASIQSVSPLALTSGNQYDGAQHYSQIEFQFYGGGFNHFISSRHDANVVYGSGNAIDFWLYSVYTGGDPQTASSAPGTGNVNTMSITASNVVINRPIQISDTSTGGTGTLTVDSGNHLYWNGTLLA
jgi:hypothetical protein